MAYPFGLIDYSKQVFWEPDIDSDANNEVVKLSSTTIIKIVEDVFLHLLPYERWQGIKRKQPVPDTSFTKCLKLDTIIMLRLPKTSLRSQHGQTTDNHTWCSTPLIILLKSARRGTLMPKETAKPAQQAIRLVGNALANMSSVERWQRAAIPPESWAGHVGGRRRCLCWCCPNAIWQVLWPESQGSHKGNQITEENLPQGAEGPPSNVLGRWHLQGQRRTQEVQAPSVRERIQWPLWCLVFKI